MANIIGKNGNTKTGTPKQPKLDLSKSTEMVCDQCGHNVFIPGAMFRKISKIQAGTPKDAVIPIDIFLCGECGRINRELLPEQIKLKEVDE